MLKKLLASRSVPPLPHAVSPAEWEALRPGMLKCLQDNVYGRMPAAVPVTAEVTESDNTFLANRAIYEKVTLSFVYEGQGYSFPVQIIRPKLRRRVPYFVTLSFREPVFDRYLPAEEIISRGFGIAIVHYKSVAGDDNDFESGLGPMAGDRTAPDAPGKIALWAWACSRVLDYVQTLDYIDQDHIALIGLSRLYLYVHFPTDVLGGMIVGVGCAWLAAKLWNRKRETGK